MPDGIGDRVAEAASHAPSLQPGLLDALCSTYAGLLRRQRTAVSAFVRWASPSRRTFDFAWLPPGKEVLLSEDRPISVEPSSPAYDAIRKMAATVELNPYEREIQYGYPYVVGFRDGVE